jgi:XRE family transcriptional regulator, regulator of sulfur utilization
MITRRDLVVAAVAVCATIAVVALADSVSTPVMKSAVFEWDKLKAESKPNGARRQVFDSRTATLDQLECHVTTLNPGQSPHPGHHHPEEELVILKEGTLEAVQNSVTNHVEPGGVIFEASNEYHSLRNTGQTPATYYVIKFVPHGLATNRTPMVSMSDH